MDRAASTAQLHQETQWTNSRGKLHSRYEPQRPALLARGLHCDRSQLIRPRLLRCRCVHHTRPTGPTKHNVKYNAPSPATAALTTCSISEPPPADPTLRTFTFSRHQFTCPPAAVPCAQPSMPTCTAQPTQALSIASRSRNVVAENENPNDQAINQITSTYINNEQNHQTTPILRCDSSDPISIPTPLQLRDCADGSIDCAALTTSTTTTFNSDCDFDSDS